MPTPTVPFKVLADGYKITGGTDAPLSATVAYLVAWSDAFTFANQSMGSRVGATVGPIVSYPPYQFPPSPNLFARSFECEPCGADGGAISQLGLAPGDGFFTHAKITVTFEPPSFNPLGDVSWQLDPTNPITYCEVEVEQSGKFETLKASGYEFDDATPVTGDLAKVVTESRLVLTFPQIPFLPWQQIQPYIGCVNLNPIFDAPAGTCLLEGTRIKFKPTSIGLQDRSVQLVFVSQTLDWNMIPKPNGVYALVRKKGATSERIYKYVDFSPIFSFLE